MLNMEVFECITTRRSIRKYLDMPVEWDKVGTILEAGRLAPNSGNIQDYSFIVVQDEEKRKSIAEASLRQQWMSKAPVHIVVCSDLKKSERFYGIRGERLYSVQNCAAAVENMLLTANSLDLGACWVGAFDENVVSRVLGIPDYVRPQAIITIGYSDEKPKAPQKFPLTTVAFIEKYGNRVKDMPAVMHDYSLIMERNLKKGKAIFESTGKKTGNLLTEKGKELAKKIKEKFKK